MRHGEQQPNLTSKNVGECRIYFARLPALGERRPVLHVRVEGSCK